MEVVNEKSRKNNKWVAKLYYCSSICFYIVSIFNFINNSNSIGVMFLCLGSTFLCLGSVYLNKDKEKIVILKDDGQ